MISVSKRYNNNTMTDNDTLPQNVDDLTKLVITQRDQLANQSLFIDQLLEQIKLTQHQRFGVKSCLLYTSPSPRDRTRSRMPSSA